MLSEMLDGKDTERTNFKQMHAVVSPRTGWLSRNPFAARNKRFAEVGVNV